MAELHRPLVHECGSLNPVTQSLWRHDGYHDEDGQIDADAPHHAVGQRVPKLDPEQGLRIHDIGQADAIEDTGQNCRKKQAIPPNHHAREQAEQI